MKLIADWLRIRANTNSNYILALMHFISGILSPKFSQSNYIRSGLKRIPEVLTEMRNVKNKRPLFALLKPFQI